MVTLEEWKSRPSRELSLELRGALAHPHITWTGFAEKEELLQDGALRSEVGYRQGPDGVWLVCCACPLPEVTPDMVRWWFWWHPKEDARYQAWYPEAHISCGYRESDRDYFERQVRPHFRDNVQYRVERIGAAEMPCTLKFVKPEEFALDSKELRRAGVAVALCANVGAGRGALMHSQMMHLFFKDGQGLFLVSRFWLGSLLPFAWMRRRMVTEGQAHDMCEHCLIECRNLAERLPGLYADFGPGDGLFAEEPDSERKGTKQHRKRRQ